MAGYEVKVKGKVVNDEIVEFNNEGKISRKRVIELYQPRNKSILQIDVPEDYVRTEKEIEFFEGFFTYGRFNGKEYGRLKIYSPKA